MVRYFIECPEFGSVWCFHITTLELWFGEESHGHGVAFSLHCIRVHTTWVRLIPDHLNLRPLVVLTHARFLHCRVTVVFFTRSLSFPYFESKPYSREEELSSTFWYESIFIYYLYFLGERLVSHSQFSYSIIYLYQHGIIEMCSLTYNPILSLFILLLKWF